jgi:CubicO group peptidase (beta-lactamase class C family)
VRIGGFVAPGFGPVADEFRRNFAERGELGAAFAVMRVGELVVDLWGGIADRATSRPWTAGTLQIVFSGTKGLTAACILILLQRGQLDLDVPVARYWPEFATAGKSDARVRDLVSHTVGLPGLDLPVTWREALDARRMADLLASQPRNRDPRATRTYHAVTFGWLCGELVRRVDGRSIGRFFAEEVAGPLGLEIWIGLPPELEPSVSTVELAASWGSAQRTRAPDREKDPLQRAINNPPRYEPGSFPWNEPAWHAAEVPSSNGIGTARSIARFYASLDRMLTADVLRLAATPLSTRYDPLMGRQTSFGVGFQLQTDTLPLGPPADAFGHGGAGGSRHGRWPRQRLGFSYAMNLLRDDPGDVRAEMLLTALHGCLDKEAAA